MRARPRRPSGSSTTRAAPTRWARCTRARRRWTGWRRSRSAASRSRRLRRRRSGATSGSTLLIRPGTWTLPSRWSGACASSTARSPCSTRSPACSRSPRRSGARPTSTRCRGSRSSTRWTAPARTSSPPCSRCATASARTRCRCRSRSAQEEQLPAASIDLVEMQAIVYKDDLGQEFDVGEIPAELAEQAHEYHHQLIDAISHFDDEVLEAYIEDESSVTRRPDQARAARRHARRRDHAGAARLRLQEQGRPAAARRGDRLPAEPARRAADPAASTRRPRTRSSAPASMDAPFSALAFKVMSDPYVGKLTYFRVYSGKLKAGDRVLNTTTGKTERIGRILQMHANHREEREEIGAGEIAAGVGLKADDDRRHALGRVGADRARVDDLPRAGDLGRRRAEVEGRPGQARLGPRAARRGGSDLPRHHRRGDRPDADRRHGRAPPRDHRRPPQARVQRRRERRPAAGRLPRDDLAARREDPGPVRPPDRRLGPVRRRR